MTGIKAFIFIFLTMPLGHAMMIMINKVGLRFQVWSAVFMIFLGIGLISYSQFVKSEKWQTVNGALAGIFLWTGAIEYGLKFAAARMQVKAINGTLGEYHILKHTWGMVLIIFIYLLFQESIRCNFIRWIRKKLKFLKIESTITRVKNYSYRVAFEMIMLLWTFYVILLLAYDETIFGVHHFITYAIFILSLGFGIYLFFKLIRYKNVGASIRYAIPTVIVFWNAVEIMAKWGIFKEPWITLNRPILISIALAFSISNYFIIKEIKKTRDDA